MVSVRPTVSRVLGELDPWLARGHHSSNARVGVRFPLLNNPKVDVLAFNGTRDVMNWLYQMEHLFAIHETPVEERVKFCVT